MNPVNPALEAEKAAITANLNQAVMNTLIADLAAARLKIRELEAMLAGKKE